MAKHMVLTYLHLLDPEDLPLINSSDIHGDIAQNGARVQLPKILVAKNTMLYGRYNDNYWGL